MSIIKRNAALGGGASEPDVAAASNDSPEFLLSSPAGQARSRLKVRDFAQAYPIIFAYWGISRDDLSDDFGASP
jgi:hypothetical protein